MKELNIADLLPFIAENLSDGRSVTLPISGYSMIPLIYPRRDSVILAAATAKMSDVVLHKSELGKVTLHRITGINGDKIILNGDGETRSEIVSASGVIAVATGFIRNGVKIEAGSAKYMRYIAAWKILKPIRRLLVKIIKGKYAKRLERFNKKTEQA